MWVVPAPNILRHECVLVQRHGAAVIRALAAAYHVSWPAGPILVDLSCESGPNLACTTEGPAGTAGHTVIAPTKASEPDVAFEIVFHEASHTVDAQITQRLELEAGKQQVKIPAELWHALIFYTTGEIVKRELRKQGDPAYKPYAYRCLYGKNGWEKMRTALERGKPIAILIPIGIAVSTPIMRN